MIREAVATDAKSVAPLIAQAMGDLTDKFTNSNNPEIAISLFEHFFALRENQYSFENTLVFEDDNNKILGTINGYDGADLIQLRRPFLNYLEENYNTAILNINEETQAGEFYIDTISVNPIAQGKGIGKKLINAIIDWAKTKGHNKLGLLVDKNNPRALKLYQSLSFKIENEVQFVGGFYHHMTYENNL